MSVSNFNNVIGSAGRSNSQTDQNKYDNNQQHKPIAGEKLSKILTKQGRRVGIASVGFRIE